MPVERLFPTKKLQATKSVQDATFRYEIYTNPASQSDSVKAILIKQFGTRLLQGQPCLGVTTERVADGIANEDYSALGFVRNKNANDVASGSIQYYDWCGTGQPQLWINDLCRITHTPDGSKPTVSPVPVLLELFETLATDYKVSSMYLMVEETEPERTKLPMLYAKYGYALTQDCSVEGYRIMKKDLRATGGKKTRKQRRGGRKNI